MSDNKHSASEWVWLYIRFFMCAGLAGAALIGSFVLLNKCINKPIQAIQTACAATCCNCDISTNALPDYNILAHKIDCISRIFP